MPKRHKYLIAYDTPCCNRRAIMLARIQGFGVDPQLSFHECELSMGERRELWAELAACCDTKHDKLLLLRLDPRNSRWRFGLSTAKIDPALTYIG